MTYKRFFKSHAAPNAASMPLPNESRMRDKQHILGCLLQITVQNPVVIHFLREKNKSQ
jgi:hypothetical protein